jgi:thiol:disulfide interchange protein
MKTARRILGFCLYLAPFVMVGFVVGHYQGYAVVFKVYAAAAVMLGCIFLGIHLMVDKP